MVPVVDVYRSNQDGSYILIEYVPSKTFGNIGWGNPIMISAEIMGREGLAIIMKSLRSYKERAGITNGLGLNPIKMSNRRYKCVGIALRDNLFELQSTKPERGGYVGTPEGRFNVNLPLTQEQLMQYLNRAFEACE